MKVKVDNAVVGVKDRGAKELTRSLIRQAMPVLWIGFQAQALPAVESIEFERVAKENGVVRGEVDVELRQSRN